MYPAQTSPRSDGALCAGEEGFTGSCRAQWQFQCFLYSCKVAVSASGWRCPVCRGIKVDQDLHKSVAALVYSAELQAHWQRVSADRCPMCRGRRA